MKKIKNNKKNRNLRAQRDHNIITKQKLLRSKVKYYRREKFIQDDRRLFRPSTAMGALYFDGTPVRYKLVKPKGATNEKLYRDYTTFRVGFHQPERVPVCSRRKNRRNVLFSIGKAGKGIRGPKRRRLTTESSIRC